MAVAAPALAALGTAGAGAAAAPAIGAGLSAGVGAATAGAASSGLFTAANALTALKVGTSLASGISQFQQGKAAAAQDEINARLSATQARQRDTQRREELETSLGAVQAARAANNLSRGSTTGRAITSEFRRVLERDRDVEVGNLRSRASALRNRAGARRNAANFSLLTGGLRAGIPLAQAFA